MRNKKLKSICNKFKATNGITLITLIITIILLIILAGILINVTIGKNGIIEKAKNAKEKYEIAQIREKIEINPKEPKYLKVVWGVGYKIEKQ